MVEVPSRSVISSDVQPYADVPVALVIEFPSDADWSDAGRHTVPYFALIEVSTGIECENVRSPER